MPLSEVASVPRSTPRGRRPFAGGARIALVVAALCVTVPAWAQPRDETPAQVLFREGREAMERTDLDVACAKFEESHRLEGAVGPLLNLANCEEKRGRIAKALSAYRAALAILRPDQVDQRALADERAKDLEARVPTLVLRKKPDAPAGTTAVLDGAAVELSERAVPVDPGKHRIEVTAPGHLADTRTIDVAVREHVDLALGPGAPLVAASPPPPPRAEGTDDGLFVGGLVAGGVGLAGLGVFAVTGIVALDASSTLEDACGPEHRCPAGDTEGHDAADTGEAMVVPNAVGLGVGIVGLGVGVTMLLLSGGEDQATALDLGPSGAALRARF